MEIQQVKPSLNKMIVYKGQKGIYKFVGCTLRKNERGYYYTAELLDTKHGKSIIFCKLKDIEVEE